MEYLLTIGLLSMPVLLRKVRTGRRGLFTGLFLSLFFWGAFSPVLSLVSLSAAFLLYADCRRLPEPQAPPFFVKRPGAAMLTVFLASMAVFCAFSGSFYDYGAYLKIAEKALLASHPLSLAGCLSGPLFVGGRCDRKGPFGTAVLLTLLAELSVLAVSAAEVSGLLFVLGSFLLYFCIAGFFTLLPLLISAFYGEALFLRFYLSAAASVFTFWALSRYRYTAVWSGRSNPGEFLLSLLFLTILSAFFLLMAWKKRLVLVRPPKAAKKAGG